MVSSDLATYKTPRAIANLPLYQQSSSTTSPYSYAHHLLPHPRVSFVLRLRQSFPEDCVRLKLSSTRASQAGLKEMMTRRRVRAD